MEATVQAFVEGKPYTIASKPHPVAEIEHAAIYISGVAAIPAEIPLLIGDCVHNLRASLDHLAWQLVLVQDNHTSKLGGTLNPLSSQRRTTFGR